MDGGQHGPDVDLADHPGYPEERLSELRRALRSAGEAGRLATPPPGYLLRVATAGRDGHLIAVTPGPRWYRVTFGAPFIGLHRAALQSLLAGVSGPEHLHLDCRAESLAEIPGGNAGALLVGGRLRGQRGRGRGRRPLPGPGLGDPR